MRERGRRYYTCDLECYLDQASFSVRRSRLTVDSDPQTGSFRKSAGV